MFPNITHERSLNFEFFFAQKKFRMKEVLFGVEVQKSGNTIFLV